MCILFSHLLLLSTTLWPLWSSKECWLFTHHLSYFKHTTVIMWTLFLHFLSTTLLPFWPVTILTIKRVLTFYTPSFVFQAHYCDHVNFVPSLPSVNNSVTILTFKRVWTFLTLSFISQAHYCHHVHFVLSPPTVYSFTTLSIKSSCMVDCIVMIFILPFKRVLTFSTPSFVSQAHYCHHVHFVLSPLFVNNSLTTLSIK